MSSITPPPPALPPFTPRRDLGRTGFAATQLDIGDIADRAVPFEECVATVRRALDAGLNLVDTAPGYEHGYSEEIVGAAVRGRRESLFVIDKIDFMDQPVRPQVEKSLGLLGLDHADAFVFHAVSSMELWKKIAAPGGPMDEFGDCVKEGKTRFRGTSSHHPDVLREAIDSGLCDVVMFPVGPFVDERYVSEIVPLARARGVGTVCFKTFGAGRLLGNSPEENRQRQLRPRGKLSSGGVAVMEPPADPAVPRLTVEECVRFTLTCDPDVALLGMSFPNEQDEAFAAARSFRPLSREKMNELRRRAAEAMARHGGKAGWNP